MPVMSIHAPSINPSIVHQCRKVLGELLTLVRGVYPPDVVYKNIRIYIRRAGGGITSDVEYSDIGINRC